MNEFKEALLQMGYQGETFEGDSYEPNVTKFNKKISLVLKPKIQNDLHTIVNIANKFKTPLYPISTGKNWGFGSKLPAEDGGTIVDLSSFNKIRAIDTKFGYAVIEPGVTQQMLADALRETPYYLDVTGSGASTSIMGNSLDRGIAYNSLRVEMLSNLEVLLGNGQVLNTGFGAHTDSKLAHLYEHGIGPDLTGLFFQSNFGIVTAATIRLKKRSPSQIDFKISFNNDTFSDVFDKLADLKREGVLASIARTGDRARSFETLAPALQREYQKLGVTLTPEELKVRYDAANKYEWTSFGKIDGTAEEVKLKAKIVKGRLKNCSRIAFFSEKKLKFVDSVASLFRLHDLKCLLRASESLRKLSTGEPTDAALEMVAWPGEMQGDAVDQSTTGFILVVPLLPFTGEDAVNLNRICQQTCEAYSSIRLGITINTVSDRVLEGVISLKFDDPDSGRKCMQQMYKNLAAVDYLPYRLNVDNMQTMHSSNNSFWSTAKSLKEVFDPNSILSPGRYIL